MKRLYDFFDFYIENQYNSKKSPEKVLSGVKKSPEKVLSGVKKSPEKVLSGVKKSPEKVYFCRNF